MKIAITGASGLIGSHLVPFLKDKGHELFLLTRKDPKHSNEVQWDPYNSKNDLSKLEGMDAIIHLAGEGIADGRWTKDKKRKIRESRVIGTRNLCTSLSALKAPPKIFLSGSAIGIYGDRGDETLTEESSLGEGFLPEIGIEWESAAKEMEKVGTKLVFLRTGIVLSPKGGALKKMLPAFKLGIAGILGDGKQWMSWISIEDHVKATYEILSRLSSGDESFTGPFNIVSPNPVTNREFTKTLGRLLRRPTIFPVPKFILMILFGEMAEHTVLASQRVLPKRLLEKGFVFSNSELKSLSL